MLRARLPKKNPPMLMLDCDRLGLLAATFIATIVMAVCCFYLDVDGAEIAFRVAMTFLATYVAVHIFVRVILHTAITELVEARKNEEADQGQADATTGQAGERAGETE